jgi:hypothetical protein
MGTYHSIYCSKAHVKYKVSTIGSFPKVKTVEYDTALHLHLSLRNLSAHSYIPHFMKLRHSFTFKWVNPYDFTDDYNSDYIFGNYPGISCVIQLVALYTSLGTDAPFL